MSAITYTSYSDRFVECGDGWRWKFSNIDEILIEVAYEEWDTDARTWNSRGPTLSMAVEAVDHWIKCLTEMKKEIESR